MEEEREKQEDRRKVGVVRAKARGWGRLGDSISTLWEPSQMRGRNRGSSLHSPPCPPSTMESYFGITQRTHSSSDSLWIQSAHRVSDLYNKGYNTFLICICWKC